MTDVLGWRGVFGVLAPSTNTVVEPDYYRMAVPGVTAHIGRIHIKDQTLASDSHFEALLEQIRSEINLACARVLTAEPDYLVMGMSAETFWGGVEGNRQFTEAIESFSGLRVATGAEACRRALELFGATRIGVVTPYQAVGDANVERFFTELGHPVAAIKGLRCPTAVAIARVPEDTLREAIHEVDGDDVDAIVQVGTNLSMVSLADEMEQKLGKPVIAINAATWWMALRENGVTDQLSGYGSLLRDH
ncbi:maleate cis-trans isomerase family protein [Nocardioides sp. GXZ039]|uniref:maleate cis-trans isomerase family protein n=1 Tax=Nocardioides sp. GXZ039 TaxID=3136018 RepID=UPI0030F47CFB